MPRIGQRTQVWQGTPTDGNPARARLSANGILATSAAGRIIHIPGRAASTFASAPGTPGAVGAGTCLRALTRYAAGTAFLLPAPAGPIRQHAGSGRGNPPSRRFLAGIANFHRTAAAGLFIIIRFGGRIARGARTFLKRLAAAAPGTGPPCSRGSIAGDAARLCSASIARLTFRRFAGFSAFFSGTFL